ncbi:hypothetical protein MNB_SV-12-572 [hydrothermal vent metagenome]|uniref:Uncharacterized protein n=1 Tax=hydrothermal vent metagenome TaxID=652676 RepID=A0A1W1BQ16_9ZZZZ
MELEAITPKEIQLKFVFHNFARGLIINIQRRKNDKCRA